MLLAYEIFICSVKLCDLLLFADERASWLFISVLFYNSSFWWYFYTFHLSWFSFWRVLASQAQFFLRQISLNFANTNEFSSIFLNFLIIIYGISLIYRFCFDTVLAQKFESSGNGADLSSRIIHNFNRS